jgi:predicted XRE-type DNA-binding protein
MTAEMGARRHQATALLGIGRAEISALANYRLDGFSVERLLGFLTALGRDVDIVVKPRAKRLGRIAVLGG